MLTLIEGRLQYPLSVCPPWSNSREWGLITPLGLSHRSLCQEQSPHFIAKSSLPTRIMSACTWELRWCLKSAEFSQRQAFNRSIRIVVWCFLSASAAAIWGGGQKIIRRCSPEMKDAAEVEGRQLLAAILILLYALRLWVATKYWLMEFRSQLKLHRQFAHE